jgi:hypothetical protein
MTEIERVIDAATRLGYTVSANSRCVMLSKAGRGFMVYLDDCSAVNTEKMFEFDATFYNGSDEIIAALKAALTT